MAKKRSQCYFARAAANLVIIFQKSQELILYDVVNRIITLVLIYLFSFKLIILIKFSCCKIIRDNLIVLFKAGLYSKICKSIIFPGYYLGIICHFIGVRDNMLQQHPGILTKHIISIWVEIPVFSQQFLAKIINLDCFPVNINLVMNILR